MLGSQSFTPHHVSRRSPHSRPTDRHWGHVFPGQSVLTASFATRGPRVQIPSAPLNALIRAILGRSKRRWLSTIRDAPRHRDPALEHGFVLRLEDPRFDLKFFKEWIAGWDVSSLLFLRGLHIDVATMAFSGAVHPGRVQGWLSPES